MILKFKTKVKGMRKLEKRLNMVTKSLPKIKEDICNKIRDDLENKK